MFVTYPSNSEGSLHAARLRIISNKALFQNASRVGLPAYIQARPFAPRQWHPPNFELHQPSRAPDNNTHGLMSRVDIEVSQDLDAARQPSMDPAPERPLSPTEGQTVLVPSKKPKQNNKKQQSEDRQWLGDKVTYFGPVRNFPVLSISFVHRLLPMLQRPSSELHM